MVTWWQNTKYSYAAGIKTKNKPLKCKIYLLYCICLYLCGYICGHMCGTLQLHQPFFHKNMYLYSLDDISELKHTFLYHNSAHFEVVSWSARLFSSCKFFKMLINRKIKDLSCRSQLGSWLHDDKTLNIFMQNDINNKETLKMCSISSSIMYVSTFLLIYMQKNVALWSCINLFSKKNLVLLAW